MLFIGIEDFLESVVDNTLVALAFTRTIMKRETRPAKAVAGVTAAQLGNREYIIGMLVFSLLLSSIYTFEAARTRFWCRMSGLDLTDFGSLIIGSLKGGIHLVGGHSFDLLRQRVPGAHDEKTMARAMRMRIAECHGEYPRSHSGRGRGGSDRGQGEFDRETSRTGYRRRWQ
jgi:hypothetical protein